MLLTVFVAVSSQSLSRVLPLKPVPDVTGVTSAMLTPYSILRHPRRNLGFGYLFFETAPLRRIFLSALAKSQATFFDIFMRFANAGSWHAARMVRACFLLLLGTLVARPRAAGLFALLLHAASFSFRIPEMISRATSHFSAVELPGEERGTQTRSRWSCGMSRFRQASAAKPAPSLVPGLDQNATSACCASAKRSDLLLSGCCGRRRGASASAATSTARLAMGHLPPQESYASAEPPVKHQPLDVVVARRI